MREGASPLGSWLTCGRGEALDDDKANTNSDTVTNVLTLRPSLTPAR